LASKAGCLETFVVDAGMGMVERFRNKRKIRTRFDGLLRSVFLEGATTKDDRPTRIGGLELVYGALRQNHDYLRGLDDNLWVGFQAEYPRAVADHRKPALMRGDGVPFRGLAWTVRLSWPESTVVGDQWSVWEAPNDHPALQSFRDQTVLQDPKDRSPVILDQRFGESRVLAEIEAPKPGQDVLWLVRPGLMKNDILTIVQNIAGNVLEGTSCNLYIADIPDHEAATYLAAVDTRYDRLQTWPPTFPRLVLITRALAVSIHVYKSQLEHQQPQAESDTNSEGDEPSDTSQRMHGYAFDADATGRFRSQVAVWTELPVVSWLRRHDSKIFWKVIDQHKEDLTYLAEKVGWREAESGYNEEIDGYLDFLQTLTQPRCRDLYRIALQRFAGIFWKRNVVMVPLDRLAATLAEEFNAEQPSHSCQRSRIHLGSVYVSGSTVDSFGKSDGELATVHYFLHGSGTLPTSKTRASLLLWSPSQRGKETSTDNAREGEVDPLYGRIGKTHAVGRGGRKHFLMPRFDDNDKPIQARTPCQTYDDWQQPLIPLLANGHWQYEGHHDFVTLNLYQAISFAFFGHEPLARYLVLEVLRPLADSGFENQLSPAGKQLWGRVQEDVRQNKLREPDDWRALAVVYPSHPNTAAVVDKLLGCFKEDAREEFRCRFIPVLPVRRRQGRGAMLLSPLALERIANLFNGVEPRSRNVLFFDDAIVSGRTVREFSANLRAAGAEGLRMVAILDRLRLPAGGTKPDRLRFFWRWDLADLGTANSCTLCKAIDLGRLFLSPLAQSRLKGDFGIGAKSGGVLHL